MINHYKKLKDLSLSRRHVVNNGERSLSSTCVGRTSWQHCSWCNEEDI